MKFYTLILSILLSSCAEKFTTKDFSIAESIPTSWNVALVDSSKVIGGWWDAFDDTSFVKVLAEFNENNPDLKTLVSRLNVAKQILKINKATQIPSVNFGLSGLSRQQKLTAFGLSNDFFGGGPDTNQSNGSGSEVTSFTSSNFGLNLTMQWELDVWGKIFNRTKAATKDY